MVVVVVAMTVLVVGWERMAAIESKIEVAGYSLIKQAQE